MTGWISPLALLVVWFISNPLLEPCEPEGPYDWCFYGCILLNRDLGYHFCNPLQPYSQLGGSVFELPQGSLLPLLSIFSRLLELCWHRWWCPDFVLALQGSSQDWSYSVYVNGIYYFPCGLFVVPSRLQDFKLIVTVHIWDVAFRFNKTLCADNLPSLWCYLGTLVQPKWHFGIIALNPESMDKWTDVL